MRINKPLFVDEFEFPEPHNIHTAERDRVSTQRLSTR